MLKKKTSTLVMNMRMSARDDLPPDQAEKCTAIRTLKVAEKEKFPSSFSSSSARKADLPGKSSENSLIQNLDEMNPDPGPKMRTMVSSSLELDKDTQKLSVESTCSVESDQKFFNKR